MNIIIFVPPPIINVFRRHCFRCRISTLIWIKYFGRHGILSYAYLETYHNELKMLRCTELGLHKMFVYGTLLKGQPNHHVLMNANNGLSVFVGKARLTKKYPLVVASAYNVPYLLPLEGTGQVRTQTQL